MTVQEGRARPGGPPAYYAVELRPGEKAMESWKASKLRLIPNIIQFVVRKQAWAVWRVDCCECGGEMGISVQKPFHHGKRARLVQGRQQWVPILLVCCGMSR
jgi:hypothetical protein